MGCLNSKQEQRSSKTILQCPNGHALKSKTKTSTPTCSKCYSHIKGDVRICEQCDYRLCQQCVKNSK